MAEDMRLLDKTQKTLLLMAQHVSVRAPHSHIPRVMHYGSKWILVHTVNCITERILGLENSSFYHRQ